MNLLLNICILTRVYAMVLFQASVPRVPFLQLRYMQSQSMQSDSQNMKLSTFLFSIEQIAKEREVEKGTWIRLSSIGNGDLHLHTRLNADGCLHSKQVKD